MTISEYFRKLRGDILFHYTHENNIESIEQKGSVIYSSSQLISNGVNPSFITDSNSRNIDYRLGYNNYVFLTFSHSHPMIYKKEQEGVPLIYYSIDVSILDIPGVKITDRIATDNNVNIYTPEQAIETLDIKSCNDKVPKFTDDWYNVRKFEILIPSYIDLKQYTHQS